jgi:hypothetical protein
MNGTDCAGVNTEGNKAVAPAGVEGRFLDLYGGRFYCIANYDELPPFFMSIVSGSDHYMFLSSRGGLTAGRMDADHALFPYYTDDRIHDGSEDTGSKTILRVQTGAGTVVWEPFSIRGQKGADGKASGVTRNLYKSVYGNRVVFEEVNNNLGLCFSYEWATSEQYGFVRTARLKNLRSEPQKVEVLDGLQNLLPSSVTKRFQLEFSTLVDAYKTTELEPASGLAMLQLTSVPVDRPEPSESLRANVAWSLGLDHPCRLLSGVQLDGFRQGRGVTEETVIDGRRGAYFVCFPMELAALATRQWYIFADVNKDAVGVRKLIHTLTRESDLAAKVEEDIALGTENLVRIVAGSDGLQQTRHEPSVWYHFSSTLFNAMRGGVPDDDYWVTREDFSAFVQEMNHRVAARHKAFLKQLPEKLLQKELLSAITALEDADFERIAYEYLPFTFSRRHGDPSRPWNAFNIRIKDEHGHKILNYQGNWRDIFQNWEALSYSYPGFTAGMIFKFLDSSTIDGYNPYRIGRDGYDWEVLDPHDAWSFIGYWGDHQIVYLLRLLQQAQRYEPELLTQWLTREVFTFANVPYRIRPYADLLRTPQDTIVFDQAAHRTIMRNAAKLGADGKALPDAKGGLIHANLAEKLLIPLLVKLSNYVPEAGIWMNTQRPEWNDANNALVGNGTSMVTLYYLRRYLAFLQSLFAGSGPQEISLPQELVDLFESILATFERHASSADAPLSDSERKTILDELGLAGSTYREGLYANGVSGNRSIVSVPKLIGFFKSTIRSIDHAIRVNRRADGLYNSYNLMKVDNEEIHVHHLSLMLEGQVAVLSSGALTPEEAVTLLDALRNSALYREDQNSYILYPCKTLPSFLVKNNIPPASVEKSKLLREMLAQDDRRIVVRDGEGGVHFNAAYLNASLLRRALEEIKDRKLSKLAMQETSQICDLYEEVFQHRYFTGRSGTMHKYEGNNCIYWHMVSKLLLATREALTEAVKDGADELVLSQLRARYNSIRAGLGMHKTPAQQGAFPTDPYSHTPGFAGAQQPGMTGQVKEDFIARVGEMGVKVESGEISFVSQLITSDEFVEEASTFNYRDLQGKAQELQLDPGMLAFTYCQTPVVAHRAGPRQIVVTLADGSIRTLSGCKLDRGLSGEIFGRTGAVRRVDVYLALPAGSLP